MGLQTAYPASFKEKPKSEDTDLLLSILNNNVHYLDGETSSRISGYRKYNNYFEGIQWAGSDRKPDRHRYTMNYCEPVVVKYASLLMGDAPTIRVPLLSDVDADADVAGFRGLGNQVPDFNSDENRSEILQKVLNKIVFMDNPGARILYEGAKAGSLYGDTVLYVDYDEKKKTFKLQNVFAGYIRAAFATDDYQEVDYVIVQNIVTPNYIKRKFGVDVEPDMAEDLVGTNLVWNARKFTEQKYVLLNTYFDDEVKIVFTRTKILSKEKHGYTRAPFFFIPNRVDPFNPWGMSDLKDVIPVQDRYNLAVSNQADIIELFANPKIIGRNLTQRDVEAIRASKGNVIPLRRDADLQPFQFTSQIYPIQQEIQDSMKSIHDISGLPPVFFGTAQGSIVTGVALNAQAAPTLQIVNAKSLVWQASLKRMLSFMLEVLEDRGGSYVVDKNTKVPYKEIIGGDYNVEVETNIRMPKDDAVYQQNEINKKNFNVQATTTTMANLGIKSPQNEMMKIMWEKVHPLFTPNPELLLEQQIKTPLGMDAAVQESFQDVERLSTGENVPGSARSVDEAQVKIEVASKFVEKNADQLPPEVMQAFDQYMASLEEFINASGTSSKTIPGFKNPTGVSNFPTQSPLQGEIAPNPTLPPEANTPQAPLPIQGGGL